MSNLDKQPMTAAEVMETNALMDNFRLLSHNKMSHVVVMASIGLAYNILCEDMSSDDALEVMQKILHGFTNGEIEMGDAPRTQ